MNKIFYLYCVSLEFRNGAGRGVGDEGSRTPPASTEVGILLVHHACSAAAFPPQFLHHTWHTEERILNSSNCFSDGLTFQ